MTDNGPFDTKSGDTKSKIMNATFIALNEYGYAGLSISKISERSGLGKSSIYYHYDNKDDLLYDFLNRIIDQIEENFSLSEFSDPVIGLEILLIQGIQGDLPDDCDTARFVDELSKNREESPEPFEAYIELRAQAVHDATYRERITELDQALGTHLEQIIQTGIEQNVFREVDVENTTQILLTLVLGGIIRRTTSEKNHMKEVYKTVVNCIESVLLKEDLTFT